MPRPPTSSTSSGPEVGLHARSAIGVAELPTGSPVEVEALVRPR